MRSFYKRPTSSNCRKFPRIAPIWTNFGWNRSHRLKLSFPKISKTGNMVSIVSDPPLKTQQIRFKMLVCWATPWMSLHTHFFKHLRDANPEFETHDIKQSDDHQANRKVTLEKLHAKKKVDLGGRCSRGSDSRRHGSRSGGSGINFRLAAAAVAVGTNFEHFGCYGRFRSHERVDLTGCLGSMLPGRASKRLDALLTTPEPLPIGTRRSPPGGITAIGLLVSSPLFL